MPLIYYLTAAGQEALSAEVTQADFPLEVKFPVEYRRLLGMIEVGGHVEVIRGRLRRFPDQLIDEWLKELEDLKMVESREAGDLDEITFSGGPGPLVAPPPRAKKPAETVVLLVEDDPDQLALGELRLTMAGYQVRSVDCAKALSRYLRQQGRPDLMLLDVRLR